MIDFTYSLIYFEGSVLLIITAPIDVMIISGIIYELLYIRENCQLAISTSDPQTIAPAIKWHKNLIERVKTVPITSSDDVDFSFPLNIPPNPNIPNATKYSNIIHTSSKIILFAGGNAGLSISCSKAYVIDDIQPHFMPYLYDTSIIGNILHMVIDPPLAQKLSIFGKKLSIVATEIRIAL